MTAPGFFHWNELMTRDAERAKSFYTETIGWRFEGMPMAGGTYWVAMMDGEMVAGLLDMRGHDIPESVPEHWLPYLAVDDVDARVAKAEAAGATIMRPPFDVPNVGRIAILKQPDGAVVGWMTPTS